MKYGKNRENAMPLNQQAQIVLDMIAKAEENGAPRTGEIEAHELREIYKSTRSAYTPKYQSWNWLRSSRYQELRVTYQQDSIGQFWPRIRINYQCLFISMGEGGQ